MHKNHFEEIEIQKVEEQKRRSQALEERREIKEILRVALKTLRPAIPQDYQKYLDARTRPCTHFYDYDMPKNFYVATDDMMLPSLHGANMLYIIEPIGMTVSPAQKHTHCEVFSMNDPDEFKLCVPSFNNVHKRY